MDIKEVGNRIKQARTLRNLTLDDVANEIGVAKSTVQRYENGLIIKPKLPVLQAIADSLRVNPAWISGQDVPMTNDDSLNSLLKCRLDEINMTLEDVSKKSGVSLHWLKHIDSFIPGEFGNDEIGYTWITKVAGVIGLPGSTLRAALARQEIPVYDGPNLTPEEAFKQAQEDFKEQYRNDNTEILVSQTELEHICKYRFIDEKGKHTVDTVLEMEYIRCKPPIENSNVIKLGESYLEPNAAHERTDIEVTDEMRKHDDDIMDDPDF